MGRPLFPDGWSNFTKAKFMANVPNYYDLGPRPDVSLEESPPVERPVTWRAIMSNPRPQVPFYDRGDMHQTAIADCTLEQMTDMFVKNVIFSFVIQDDIPDAFDGIDRYLLYVKPQIEQGNRDYIDYARKVILFREDLYKLYFRYMKEHPAAYDTLFHSLDKDHSLASLFESFGLTTIDGKPIDPLVARRDPPYSIDTILAAKETVVTQGHDTGVDFVMGISKEDILKDDGSDFDFDKFIQRQRHAQ